MQKNQGMEGNAALDKFQALLAQSGLPRQGSQEKEFTS
jgi:hypothetical protein